MQNNKPIAKKVFAHLAFYWRREMYTILHDKGVLTLFLLVPLFYPILYAYIYNNEVVHEAKLVVVDENNSSLSRELIRRIDGTADVDVVGVVPQVSQAIEAIHSHQAYAYLVIPQSFSNQLNQGEQVTINLVSDISSMLYYKAFMVGCNLSALQMGRDFQQTQTPSASQQMALITVQPVPNEDIALFNNHVGYASFLLPLVLVLIIQQTMLLGVGMLAGTYRERNKQHRLFSSAERKLSPGVVRIVWGKSLAYITVYAVLSLWVLVLVPAFFDLPRLTFNGSSVFFLFSFLVACTFFCLFISCFIPNRESSIIYLAFTSVIFMFLTGIVWPQQVMPPIWRTFANIIPSTPGAKAFVALVSLGADSDVIAPYLVTLWLQTLVYFILSTVGYAFMLKRK